MRPVYSLSSRTLLTISMTLLVLHASQTFGEPFKSGDLFVGRDNGRIDQYRDGVLMGSLSLPDGEGTRQITGLCFSTNGKHLFATSVGPKVFGQLKERMITRFNDQGKEEGFLDVAYPTVFHPRSCVTDAEGHLYILFRSYPAYIKKYNSPSFTSEHQFRPEPLGSILSIESFDIDSDQCTIFYTLGRFVKRFNVCTNTPAEVFSTLTGICSDVRIDKRWPAPGHIFVTCTSDATTAQDSASSAIVQLRRDGSVARYYETSACEQDHPAGIKPFTNVNLAPGQGPSAFWAFMSNMTPAGSDKAEACKLDVRTGLRLSHFIVEGQEFFGVSKRGIAIFREPSAAQTQCSDGLDNDGDGAIDLADTGCPVPEDVEEGRCFNTRFGRVCLSRALPFLRFFRSS